MPAQYPAAYVALLHLPEPNSSTWGVTFPDLPGCVSSGRDDSEALANAREALAGHVAALRADGEHVPAARSPREIHDDPDFIAETRDSVIDGVVSLAAMPAMIQLDDVAPPKERVNVMLDRGVLRKIDEAARARGISRSAFIEQAAGKAALKRSA